MDYFLTEEQRNIRALARRIAEEKVVPVRAELDETGTFPWDIMKTCAENRALWCQYPLKSTAEWVAAPLKTVSLWKS